MPNRWPQNLSFLIFIQQKCSVLANNNTCKICKEKKSNETPCQSKSWRNLAVFSNWSQDIFALEGIKYLSGNHSQLYIIERNRVRRRSWSFPTVVPTTPNLKMIEKCNEYVHGPVKQGLKLLILRMSEIVNVEINESVLLTG